MYKASAGETPQTVDGARLWSVQPRHRAPWLKRGDVAAMEPLKPGSNTKAGGPAGSEPHPSNKPVSGGSTGSDLHPSDKLAQGDHDQEGEADKFGRGRSTRGRLAAGSLGAPRPTSPPPTAVQERPTLTADGTLPCRAACSVLMRKYFAAKLSPGADPGFQRDCFAAEMTSPCAVVDNSTVVVSFRMCLP